MTVRNLKICYQLVLILISCWLALRIPARSGHAWQESSRPRTHILAIDDRAYPDVQVYLTVTDIEAAVPVRNLTAQDFLVTAAGTQRIVPSTVTTSTINNRPVHLIVVLDLTGSVSPQEFTNMQTAAALLIASLEVQDQVGVVTMDHQQAALLQPLSPDHNAAINAMYRCSANGGGVYRRPGWGHSGRAQL
jgi:Mg-chelatase subunit ChlD